MLVSRQIICPHCGGINRVPAEQPADAVRCGRCRTPLFSAKPIDVDAAALNKHIQQGDLPVLAQLWAPWCSSCVVMASAYEAAAYELEPDMRLVKLNSDAEPEMAARLRVQTIPTMILFSDGVEVARVSGGGVAGGISAWARARLADVQIRSSMRA
ncbi:thioredoxin domain-containing protein [Aquamicrobium segne]|uniref:Thioredoxin domain-containing protein n=1 Tax=Aquamicrobium segne TaxID=469547 RepID=A0ABW0H010_9HYPH